MEFVKNVLAKYQITHQQIRDFNVTCYKNAPSFEAALEMFFNNFHRDLREALTVHRSEAKTLSGNAYKHIMDFYATFVDILDGHVKEFVALLALHKASTNTEQEKLDIHTKSNKFNTALSSDLSKLRAKSKNYLIMIEHSPQLKIDAKVVHALTIWQTLTRKKLMDILILGEIPWLS